MILLFALIQLILIIGGGLSVLAGVVVGIAAMLTPERRERARRVKLARPLFFLGLAALVLSLILTALAHGG